MTVTTDKVKSDAKHVEAELRLMGEFAHAEKVARLRIGYSRSIGALRTLHRDNIELRKQLGLPSFLDAEKKEK